MHHTDIRQNVAVGKWTLPLSSKTSLHLGSTCPSLGSHRCKGPLGSDAEGHHRSPLSSQVCGTMIKLTHQEQEKITCVEFPFLALYSHLHSIPAMAYSMEPKETPPQKECWKSTAMLEISVLSHFGFLSSLWKQSRSSLTSCISFQRQEKKNILDLFCDLLHKGQRKCCLLTWFVPVTQSQVEGERVLSYRRLVARVLGPSLVSSELGWTFSCPARETVPEKGSPLTMTQGLHH
jgi:hypothetical protein